MMKKQQDKNEAVEQEDGPKDESSRRDFLRTGSLGLGGLAGAAALGIQPSQAEAQENGSGKKRVTILFDSWNHMMPA